MTASELRALVEDMMKWHEDRDKACLAAAKKAEADGHEHLARHMYAASGVHETSAAWIRHRILPAAASEGSTKPEAVTS